MYVDAIESKGVIKVVERVDSKRVYTEYPVDYHLYISDPRGTHTTIYGTPVKKLVPKTLQEKQQLIRMYPSTSLWESDINPVIRCLESNYSGKPLPKLHVAFYDIEVSFDQVIGYSSPADALTPIISIAVYLQWVDQMVCIAVPPPNMLKEDAIRIANEVGNTIIVDTEKDILDMFLTLIEDADILSGWNCAFYDRPYIIHRIVKVMGAEQAKRLCLWGKSPKKRNIDRGGKREISYDTIGRVSLDYMDLYKKYSYEERQSYSLDNISKEELNSQKVPYNGTLDQLYKQDFKLFLEYNIQDTKLLDDLDKKLQYIDLSNVIAHSNVVLLPATMGAVATTEQAIICSAHAKGLVVHDKKNTFQPSDSEEDDIDRAAGGWVSSPKTGLHKWVASSDLNSLYPSTIRALNMSSETIVGQIRSDQTDAKLYNWCAEKSNQTFARWWNDRFTTLEMENYFNTEDRPCQSDKLILDMESGESYELTTAELKALICDSGKPWCISANGTIFRTDKQGVIPGLLEQWYSERKVMQKAMRSYKSLVTNDKGAGVACDPLLYTPTSGVTPVNPYILSQVYSVDIMTDLVESGDIDEISKYIDQHGLKVEDGYIRAIDQKLLKEHIGYWDKKQHVTKILLNSLYGGLLNKSHRFFDKRIGQSTTLTGRCITRHMTAKTNELLSNEYDYKGRNIIYNDTDSCIGSTMIETLEGSVSIEELFNQRHNGVDSDDKEYVYDDDLLVMSYNKNNGLPYYGHINYIYRHKVSKQLYEVEDEHGNKVTITEDHSIMVLRDNELIEIKPNELSLDDNILSIK